MLEGSEAVACRKTGALYQETCTIEELVTLLQWVEAKSCVSVPRVLGRTCAPFVVANAFSTLSAPEKFDISPQTPAVPRHTLRRLLAAKCHIIDPRQTILTGLGRTAPLVILLEVRLLQDIG
jgi:hypothetical protein